MYSVSYISHLLSLAIASNVYYHLFYYYFVFIEQHDVDLLNEILNLKSQLLIANGLY